MQGMVFDGRGHFFFFPGFGLGAHFAGRRGARLFWRAFTTHCTQCIPAPRLYIRDARFAVPCCCHVCDQH